jgi:acetyltransferase-like isoleucine patch superfamily enzyme
MILGDTYLSEEELRSVGFRSVGRHARIHKRASIYCPENISFGDHARVDDFAVIIATGPIYFGDYVHVPNFCFLGGTFGITLEDFSTLAPGVMIFSSSDDYSGRALTNATVPRQFLGGKKAPVVLQKHVIVGAGSVILPGCTLGEGASVGALSLVKESLEPWGVYAGVPAIRLKDRQRDLLALEVLVRQKHAD